MAMRRCVDKVAMNFEGCVQFPPRTRYNTVHVRRTHLCSWASDLSQYRYCTTIRFGQHLAFQISHGNGKVLLRRARVQTPPRPWFSKSERAGCHRVSQRAYVTQLTMINPNQWRSVAFNSPLGAFALRKFPTISTKNRVVRFVLL